MGFERLGKLKRGSLEPGEFAFYGFRGGLNVRAAAQLVADDELTIAYNGYLRPDGAFLKRNGMNPYGNLQAGTNQLILARFYQDVINGAAQSPELVALLGQFGNTLYSIPSSGAWTSLGSINSGTNANPMTFARIQNPNDPHFPSGLTDCIVICTGSGGPYVWDGTNLYVPAGWSQAASASFCAVVNGILWFGGIKAFPNQIFGTGDGIIQSMETLPAIRNFVCTSPVFGLCAQGSGATATLIIGLNGGVSVLYGTGPSTFYKQDIPFSGGVVSGRSMVVDQGVVYFMGHDAMYSFDGQTIPRQISIKVEPWILNDPIIAAMLNQYPLTANGPSTWAQIVNNRLFIGYCSGTTVPNTLLCYDLIVQGWTVLQTTPGLSCLCPLDAPSDANPNVVLAGSSTTGQAYTWDYVAPFTGPVAAVMDGTTPVLAAVQSKFFKVGTPGVNKMLLRYYPEFYVSGNGFIIPITLSTDYGVDTMTTIINNTAGVAGILIWDAGMWDVGTWAGAGFSSFNAPESRVDFNAQAEAFAFGAAENTSLAPWIWSGGSGVFAEKGRT